MIQFVQLCFKEWCEENEREIVLCTKHFGINRVLQRRSSGGKYDVDDDDDYDAIIRGVATTNGQVELFQKEPITRCDHYYYYYSLDSRLLDTHSISIGDDDDC